MNNAIQTQSGTTLQKILLICGILAPTLYAGADILAGTLYPNYSFSDQAVSELFAIGSPTGSLVVSLFTIYSLLVFAFALGVWISSGRNRPLQLVAFMLIANAVNGLVLWNFFPMHMRGAEMTFTDTMHVILAAMGGIYGSLAIGFGAVAFGRQFRFYSIATIVMLFAPSTLAFSFVPQVASNESSPWLGLSERIAFAGYMQWQIVLSIVILRKKSQPQRRTREALKDVQ